MILLNYQNVAKLFNSHIAVREKLTSENECSERLGQKTNFLEHSDSSFSSSANWVILNFLGITVKITGGDETLRAPPNNLVLVFNL